jgi:hypothetical protein
MNKKIRTIVIVIVCVAAAALLMHLTMSNFIPFISNLHSGAAY